MKSRPNYISLFSSAGVGCYGFLQEGFECIVTSELLPKRLAIQKYNNVCESESGYISGDLKDPLIKERIIEEVEEWRRNHSGSSIDILVATPPCQGISVANLKKKNELERNSLVVESLRLTKLLLPKVFIYENVRGFLKAICTDVDGKDKPIKDAILSNLNDQYDICYEIINFKDYGVPSSRTRTLVIGVKRDEPTLNTDFIFPSKDSEVTLRESLQDLEDLKVMGAISSNDIYHNFRPYPAYMEEWIKDLKQGEGAFSNNNPEKVPHRWINGVRVQNKNKSGDKYKRWYWDKPGPCIHTRNDQLASQNTIHPSENRVFSIRELMRMMSIPDLFKWTDIPAEELNSYTYAKKRDFLKKNEMNIRQCIGEAVPTLIFNKIAKNYMAHYDQTKH